MASVTMKAFTRSLMMKKLLMQPTPAPMASMRTMTSAGGSCQPEPKNALVDTIQAPTSAVNPSVDSEDRSKRPASRQKIMPITRMPRIDECSSTLMKIRTERRRGSTAMNAMVVNRSTIQTAFLRRNLVNPGCLAMACRWRSREAAPARRPAGAAHCPAAGTGCGHPTPACPSRGSTGTS